MKGTNSPNQFRERDLREAIAGEERRLAELGEEARRAQARLAALQSDLASTIGASATQANVVADPHDLQPRPTPRSSAEKIAVFRSLFRGRDDIYPVRFVSKRTGKAGTRRPVRISSSAASVTFRGSGVVSVRTKRS